MNKYFDHFESPKADFDEQCQPIFDLTQTYPEFKKAILRVAAQLAADEFLDEYTAKTILEDYLQIFRTHD